MRKPGLVTLVGCGPGDPDLLTVKADRLIRNAGVVVFDRLVSPQILSLLPERAERHDVGKESGRHALPQDGINELLASLARSGRDVLRLKGGDPFVFGRGGEEALYLAGQGIPCEAIPGVTAAAGCAASVGIPLTHRGLADGLRLVTGHRQDGVELELDFARLADPNCTLVVYMGVGSAARLSAGLMEHGLPADTPVAVIERGTTPDQRLIRTHLAALPETLASAGVKPPALLMIGKVAALSLAPALAAETVDA
jgi:uroporphyrin-III C-methyltransferase